MNIEAQFLQEVEAIARRAGHAIMRVYARKFSVQEKVDRSPLTEADLAAHAVIVDDLGKLTPSLPILSEEAVEAFPRSFSGERYWLVDPLDGTKEFIKRNGEFTVNIALVERGRAVLGVVHAPAIEVTYAAACGLGAFRRGKDGAAESIHVAIHQDGTPWRVVGSRSHAGASLNTFLQRLGAHELTSIGSSLKLCLVADGSADLYPRLGPTSLWDTAAAQCVVEQAGGMVVTVTGEPLRYDDPAAVLNPSFVVHGQGASDWRDALRHVEAAER
jgi:3'(2'), 5'-bisphosphate nucleotidase